jgi:hypothetical protein
VLHPGQGRVGGSLGSVGEPIRHHFRSACRFRVRTRRTSRRSNHGEASPLSRSSYRTSSESPLMAAVVVSNRQAGSGQVLCDGHERGDGLVSHRILLYGPRILKLYYFILPLVFNPLATSSGSERVALCWHSAPVDCGVVCGWELAEQKTGHTGSRSSSPSTGGSHCWDAHTASCRTHGALAHIAHSPGEGGTRSP